MGAERGGHQARANASDAQPPTGERVGQSNASPARRPAGERPAHGSERNDGDGDGAHDDLPGEDGGGEENDELTLEAQIERLWSRSDGGRWTLELKNAHVAFERGRSWGIEWTSCVDKFFDFEAVWSLRAPTRSASAAQKRMRGLANRGCALYEAR
ncbi:hypothetical protein B0H10DRAFT_2096586 [Mycena sp. CBHHK59/15]|nr:hypothetical protein B0H10DRAFT_2122296 [Mycena sp. CBHHK59/15]KAJ6583729.1 hypothetical protein B0H10DRAFT_2096586 [Mycena sp. CBHHK59/15]